MSAPISYIDMDITMENLGDEIECIDEAIGAHIERGLNMSNLLPLAKLRANLSLQRKRLHDAMDNYESHDEKCDLLAEVEVLERDFDSEITMSGRGFISLETIR